MSRGVIAGLVISMLIIDAAVIVENQVTNPPQVSHVEWQGRTVTRCSNSLSGKLQCVEVIWEDEFR